MQQPSVGVSVDPLKDEIQDADIIRIAGELPNWQLVATQLGMGFQDIEGIETNRTPAEQRVAFLNKWIQNKGDAATYEKLIEVLKSLGEQGAAKRIERICKQGQKSPVQPPLPPSQSQPPSQPLPSSQQQPPPQPQPPAQPQPSSQPQPDEANELYEEAMKFGSVKMSIIKCLVLGIAGVGKTCLKRLLLQLPQNVDGPIGRVSTGLADNPIQSFVGSVSSMLLGVDEKEIGNWEVLDEIQLMKVIANAYQINPLNPSLDSLPISTMASKAIEEVESIVIKAINSKRSDVKNFNVTLVHFIDSGGQPQFMELLPAFVQDLSAILYAVNLSESLDDCPMIYFYGQDGQPVGEPYKSPLSHKQVLEQCVRATYTGDVHPQVFVVGTHKDKENECSEKKEDKNTRIRLIMGPTDCLVEKNETEAIWDVNGINPDSKDQDVANTLRRAIVSRCNKDTSSPPLPMKWFVLKMQITRSAVQGVLSQGRCLKLAKGLRIDERGLEKALLHMVKYNLFLWYNEIPELRNVVISDPQVILKIITDLVQCKHDLAPLSNNAGIDATLRNFKAHAIVTRELLLHDQFKKHFIEDIFTVDLFITLMCHLFIMVDVKKGNYLMPALLDPLGDKKISQENQLIDPLLICFPNDIVPRGLFSFLVAFLQTKCSIVASLKDGKEVPACLHRDRISLKEDASSLAQFTIIDSVTYIKVHLELEKDWRKVEDCSKACLQIKQVIREGIEISSERLHYKGWKGFQYGFICSNGHVAKVPQGAIEFNKAVCSCGENMRLTEKHTIWLSKPEPLSEDKCEKQMISQIEFHALYDNVQRLVLRGT